MEYIAGITWKISKDIQVKSIIHKKYYVYYYS